VVTALKRLLNLLPWLLVNVQAVLAVPRCALLFAPLSKLSDRALAPTSPGLPCRTGAKRLLASPAIGILVESMSNARFHCPCCGYPTLSEQPPGTFDICTICGWEDDNVQFNDPSYRGGANEMSLDEARRQFETSGGRRSPTDEERRSRIAPVSSH
jgi:hypothetical protein